MKRIAFRVDANELIATGHLMRCIAIAKQFQTRGIECHFFLAEDKQTDKLRSYGLPYTVLESRWDRLDGEISVITESLREYNPDFMIVDSYQVTQKYITALSKMVPVMYIDDIGMQFEHLDMILRYGFWEIPEQDNLFYAKNHTEILAGHRYTPLREEFSRNHEMSLNREKAILITTGGTDPYNIGVKVLKRLCEADEWKEYTFHVIVGVMNQFKKELYDIGEKNSRVYLHDNIPNICDYMRCCEYAISAGGTTLLELCACKTLTVCFSFSDNQKERVKSFERHRLMLCAGDAREVKGIEQVIADRLMEFRREQPLRERCTMEMEQLLDGNGTRQIADAIIFRESRKNEKEIF